MNIGVEESHETLVEVGLPSTIADMKNPTEEYILTLITQFLATFQIDVSAVRKPLFEQLSLEVAEEDHDIISLINLTMIVANIGVKIFIKDFHLMDIMSPVPKRSRRIAKLMANFVLYAKNKLAEVEENLEETRVKEQQLQQLRNQRNAVKQAKNEAAMRIGKKKELLAHLEMETARLMANRTERKSRIEYLEAKLNEAEQEKLELVQRHSNLAAQAIKEKKKTEDIISKHVTSPDRHNALLRDINERKKQKNERREVIMEALKTKKPAIERFKSSMTFVSQLQMKLLEISEFFKNYEELQKKMDQIQKKKAELTSLIEQASTAGRPAKGNEVNDAPIQEARENFKKHLSIYHEEHKECLNMKKALEKKMEDAESRLQEILSEKDDIRSLTAKKESECIKFLEDCKEIWKKEIKEEMKFRKVVEQNLPNFENSINSTKDSGTSHPLRSKKHLGETHQLEIM